MIVIGAAEATSCVGSLWRQDSQNKPTKGQPCRRWVLAIVTLCWGQPFDMTYSAFLTISDRLIVFNTSYTKSTWETRSHAGMATLPTTTYSGSAHVTSSLLSHSSSQMRVPNLQYEVAEESKQRWRQEKVPILAAQESGKHRMGRYGSTRPSTIWCFYPVIQPAVLMAGRLHYLFEDATGFRIWNDRQDIQGLWFLVPTALRERCWSTFHINEMTR